MSDGYDFQIRSMMVGGDEWEEGMPAEGMWLYGPDVVELLRIVEDEGENPSPGELATLFYELLIEFTPTSQNEARERGMAQWEMRIRPEGNGANES